MTVLAQLVLARSLLSQGDRRAAAVRVAAADADLASFPSPLGLTDLRDEVAALAGVGPPPLHTLELLSERELTVLHYVRSDLSFQEIAAHLYVSVNTIKTHARHVYRKLGVSGRHELSHRRAKPRPRPARRPESPPRPPGSPLPPSLGGAHGPDHARRRLRSEEP